MLHTSPPFSLLLHSNNVPVVKIHIHAVKCLCDCTPPKVCNQMSFLDQHFELLALMLKLCNSLLKRLPSLPSLKAVLGATLTNLLIF